MIARYFAGLVFFAALGAASGARAQPAMLAPPSNHYFLSKGTWGQKYPDQWGLQRIGFDSSPKSAWRLVKRNAHPVIVAVIDTGLDWNHKNIARENLWHDPAAPANIGWDFLDRDNKPWDYDGHGTFVAGIIAGSWNDKDGMAGVNPFAKLMILKAINNFGHTRASYIAEAIAYAADHGARVINLSVGGKQTTNVERAAIDYAYSKGVVIVVAAGNEGVNVDDYGVAASGKVLVVAATGLDDQRLVFSNWGNVSVAAPGLDILSLRARRTDTMLGIAGVKYKAGAAYVGADKRYYRASGTSFSAPFVSGLASLMLANDPSLTNRQVIRIIKSTARDTGIAGVDQYTGYGIVDARAALAAPKDYRLLAQIDKVEVVEDNGQQAVRVYGTADANQFKSAHIEVGQGEKPASWTQVGPVAETPGPDGVLGDIPAAALMGASVWQIRLIVEHSDGSVREARFRLNTG